LRGGIGLSEFFSKEFDFSGGDFDTSADAADQGGFSSPVRSQESDPLPGSNPEAHPSEGFMPGVGFAKIGDFQGHAHGRSYRFNKMAQ
jgi:hypothetical protein